MPKRKPSTGRRFRPAPKPRSVANAQMGDTQAIRIALRAMRRERMRLLPLANKHRVFGSTDPVAVGAALEHQQYSQAIKILEQKLETLTE